MERINRRLDENQRFFFNNMSNYIGEKIHFYGSILRADYVPGKSDFDIDIYSDNISSTIHKLCLFLNVQKYEFKNIIKKIDNKIIRGFKAKYVNEEYNIDMEISVFNEKYKNLVLFDRSIALNLPFHIYLVLCIVKFLYYYTGLLSKDIYKRIKRLILNDDDLRFVQLDE